MRDLITKIGESWVQHGKLNNRVYLMRLKRDDVPDIIHHMENLAEENGYSKIFAKVSSADALLFDCHGYRTEAIIPGFFNGKDDAHFVVKYFNAGRSKEKRKSLLSEVLEKAARKNGTMPEKSLGSNLVCRRARPEDSDSMADLYGKTFPSYPFPVFDASYLLETMEHDIVYWGIWDGAIPLALASAEVDIEFENAEMTDFATRPEARGKGFARVLLSRLEQEMAERGIRTAYTIARSYSLGMNMVFAGNDYHFAGTLTNNTQISGGLESMNVWYKRIDPGNT